MKMIQFFVDRPVVGNVLTVGIILGAMLAAGRITREQFPAADSYIVMITTIYRGSVPEEIENYITNPLEEEIRSLRGIRDYTSRTYASVSEITVLLEGELTADAKDEAVQEIKEAVDRVRPDLPENIEEPVVEEFRTDRAPVVDIALYLENGRDFETNEVELRGIARALADRLESNVKGISVRKNGYRDPEIHVELLPGLLKSARISAEEIDSRLRTENVSFPGGSIVERGREYLLRTDNQFEDTAGVGATILRGNYTGGKIRLGQVARVRRGFEKKEIIEKANGREAIFLAVSKNQETDAPRALARVREQVIRFLEAGAPASLRVSYLNNRVEFIRSRLRILSTNILLGLLLLAGALFLFLGPRTTLVVALGIPFAFGITLLSMYAAGISLNLISLFTLLIVSGMLVDDAIIVAEYIEKYREAGMPAREAAVRGVREILPPLIAAIATTVIAFWPIAAMSGVMGRVMWIMPVIVTIALLASLFESLFILPSHTVEFGGDASAPGRVPGDTVQKRIFARVAAAYEPVLRIVLDRPGRVAAGAVFFFLTGIGLIGLLGFKMSSGGLEAFYVLMEAKAGTPLKEMNAKVRRAEELVAAIPRAERESYATRVGIQAPDPMDPFNRRAGNVAQITVFLTPPGTRDRGGDEIMAALQKEFERIDPGGEIFEKVEMKRDHSGPPVGSPVQLEIRGEDYGDIETVARQARDFLNEREGVFDVRYSHRPGKPRITLEIEPEQAARLGVSPERIGHTAAMAFDGRVSTTIRTGREAVGVRVKYADSDKKGRAALEEVLVRNATGNLSPLSAMTSFESGTSTASISHNRGRRAVFITAEVNDRVTTAGRVKQELEEHLRPRVAAYPAIEIRTAGEARDQADAMTDFAMTGAFALIGILVVLVILFDNFGDILTVLAAIPLGFAGVGFAFAAHKIFQSDLRLTFMAVLGAIALAGVLLNDSIVLIRQVRNNLREVSGEGSGAAPGRGAREAVADAARSRLRPIFLTTVTTLLGFFPLAYGLGGSDDFVRPMALALSWGLVFGTLVTLVILPAIAMLRAR